MSFKTFIAFCIWTTSVAAGPLPGKGTETIHSVAHVKRGREVDYTKLSAEAWGVYKRLGFVLDTPHIVLKGTDEKGRAFVVEVFTWKSSDIPDHAPPEVKAIWRKLEDVCEPRDGRRGIDFSEVTALQLD